MFCYEYLQLNELRPVDCITRHKSCGKYQDDAQTNINDSSVRLENCKCEFAHMAFVHANEKQIITIILSPMEIGICSTEPIEHNYPLQHF